MAPPRNVRITVPRLHCIQADDSSRDEVAFLLAGAVRRGASAALPFEGSVPGNDRYYCYEDGTQNRWVDGDGNDLGVPELWSGQLDSGDSIGLAVGVYDQDNAQIGVLLRTGLGVAAGIAAAILTVVGLAAVAGVLAAAVASLLQLIEDHKNTVLGGFSVYVENADGVLKVTYGGSGAEGRFNPNDGNALAVGPNAGFFSCSGRNSRARYNLIVDVGAS